jgi:ABC-type nickel/cobalt efflux system permease component RcnA
LRPGRKKTQRMRRDRILFHEMMMMRPNNKISSGKVLPLRRCSPCASRIMFPWLFLSLSHPHNSSFFLTVADGGANQSAMSKLLYITRRAELPAHTHTHTHTHVQYSCECRLPHSTQRSRQSGRESRDWQF